MEFTLFHVLCYVLTALFFFQAYAVGRGEVKFVMYACMYKHHYIQNPLYLNNECIRATCDTTDRKLTIEECANNDDDSPCIASSSEDQQFPFCCKSRSCKENKTVIAGIVTHYITEGGAAFSDKVVFVKPTGQWSAPMEYILGACHEDYCRYKGEKILHKTKLTTPCVSVIPYEGKGYIGAEGCPTFVEKEHVNCVKLNDGEKNDRYPHCCPMYMCPPEGRVRRNTTFVAYPEIYKGKCKYGGNTFEHTFETVEPCRLARCDVRRREVSVTTCLDEEDLKWTQCKAVAPLERRYGNYPACRPDYICPEMTVYRLLEPTTHTAEFFSDVCKFRNRYFRTELHTEDTCELWTCHVREKKVKVYRCDDVKQSTKEGCTLEVKNSKKPYPDCCERKVCRHHFPTHFPGSYIAPSPL